MKRGAAASSPSLRRSDDRHQWDYTASGVLEETGQHAAHPTVVKTTYL
jgi:hypothetical protein